MLTFILFHPFGGIFRLAMMHRMYCVLPHSLPVCVCTSVSIWHCCWTSHIWTFVLAPHSFSAASKSIRRNKPSMCVAFPHNSASALRKCVFVFVFKNAKMCEIAESLKRVAAICVRATFAPKCFLFYTYDACKLCFGVRLNRQIVARTMCAQV